MAKVIHTDITDESKIYETLKKEGFFNIFTWTDSKNTKYPLHTHPHYEVRWIVEGELVIVEDGKEIVLKAGDRLETAPNTPHAAYTKIGAKYICASR